MASDKQARRAAQERLVEAMARHSSHLNRVATAGANRANRIIDKLAGQLVSELAERLDSLTPAELKAFSQGRYTTSRLKGLRNTINRWAEDLAKELDTEVLGSLDELAGNEAEFAKKLLEAVVTNPVGTGVTAATAAAAARRQPILGELVEDMVADLPDRARRQVFSRIRQGIAQGETTSQITRALRGTKALRYRDGLMQTTRNSAETLVRTATNHFANVAYDETWQALGVSEVVDVATLDGRTSKYCFPESTGVLPVGALHSVIKRPWDGDLIVITTASGKELRATPNHPVLTARGWRAIQEVEPGNDVLYRVGVDVGSVVAAEDIEMPATMGAIFDSLNEPAFSDVLIESTAEIDFHGDGIVGEHKVNNPRSESHLRDALNASLGEDVTERLLVFIAGSPGLSALGEADSFGFREWAPGVSPELDAGAIQDCVQRGFADLELSTDVSRLHAPIEGDDDGLMVGSPAMLSASERGHDAGSLQHACNSRSGDAVFSSEGGSAGAICVIADDVVSVDREFFSGHVCNLSTGTELYIADGFVVHNCASVDGRRHKVGTSRPKPPYHYRCRTVQVPSLDSNIMGERPYVRAFEPISKVPKGQRTKGMVGTVSANTNYGQWFSRQSAAFQREWLGPARYKLYKQGGYKIDRFVDPTGKQYTLAQLRQKDTETFKEIFG